MRTREDIISEIQRVAKLLASNRVSQDDFEKHGQMSLNGVTYVFGSWNRAIEAAGLEVWEPAKHRADRALSDAELMDEIIRLTRELRKPPSDREMGSIGMFSPKPYVKRWGTFARGRQAAYDALGYPELPTSSVKSK
jgi:hypothetical protein